MMQAADLGKGHDAAFVRVDGARFGRVLGEREVRASVLIVRYVPATTRQAQLTDPPS
jgi:hypothetical protein